MDDKHRYVAMCVASRLIEEGADAVVLHGSVARGSHRSDSDVDLLVVNPCCNGLQMLEVEGLHVESVVRDAAEWRSVLDRAIPTWAYAWTEGEILQQHNGEADRLVAEAATKIHRFRLGQTQADGLLSWWLHIRPKFVATLLRENPVEVGYAASLSQAKLVESLFLIYDTVPPPASDSSVFRRLLRLAQCHGFGEELGRLFGDGRALERAEAQLSLIDYVIERCRALSTPPR